MHRAVPLLAALLAGPAAAQQAPAPPAAEVPGPDYGEPQPHGLEARLERFRKDVFFVVDAYVARKDGWVVARDAGGLPDAERDERYAVVWDAPPRLEGDAKIVSEEWVVVDGTGRLLTVAQFGVLSGVLADWKPRGGKTYLEGVQRFYDRDQIEDLAAERAAGASARAGLPPEHIAEVRAEVVAGLPQASWAPVHPAPLE